MGISLSLTSTISIYQANLRLISKFLPLLWRHVNLNINFITKLSCTISFIRIFFKLEQNNNKLLICIFVYQKKLILLYPSYGLNDSPPPHHHQFICWRLKSQINIFMVLGSGVLERCRGPPWQEISGLVKRRPELPFSHYVSQLESEMPPTGSLFKD